MKSPKDWSPSEQFEAEAIFEKLRAVATSIAFSVEWEEDASFVWDGDGPDPSDEGYIAHDVDVVARAIVGGMNVYGTASLGGVYEKPGRKDPDINGYLPQMLEEAASELAGMVSGDLQKQALAACKYLKEVLVARHKITNRE